jgi:hypothetical protein
VRIGIDPLGWSRYGGFAAYSTAGGVFHVKHRIEEWVGLDTRLRRYSTAGRRW